MKEKNHKKTDYQKNKYHNNGGNSNNNSHNNDKNKGNGKKGNCYICGKPGHYANKCSKRKELQNLEKTETNSLKLTSLIPESNNKEKLLRFNGKVNGKDAWILLDSGATRSFIDKDFVEKQHFKTSKTPALTIELADGRKQETNREVKEFSLQM